MFCIARHLVLGRSVTSCFSSKKSFESRDRVTPPFVSIAHGRRLHLRLFFFRHRVRTCSCRSEFRNGKIANFGRFSSVLLRSGSA
ncbi:hypothetical protein NDU88_009283 [Pleurodeles waltl]|uniref:Secreted protein n=1 Tax=Pleurodeles waltl TaxID=8319 RepID=A0AAV7QR40_PLEWA|nr:hypothetical protein NDU88_009283 [Pleurodeles waltl]